VNSQTLLTMTTTSPPPPLGLPNWAPWLLIAAGGVMLFFWWSGSRKSASPQGASVLSRLRGARVQNSAQPETRFTLPPESEELVDLLCQRLDDRASRIESLLAEADAAIARLEAMRAAPAPESPRPAKSACVQREQHEPPVAEVVARGPVEPTTSDPLCTSVYSLADSGADPVAIAKQLDEHIGKVQLILALRGG
jgi:hypothetical protein